MRIVKTDFKPKAYRFMLGDNCEVGIQYGRDERLSLAH